MFKFEYDSEAGYIHYKDIAPGEAVKTVEVVEGYVIVDYDKDGNLLGVELLNLK